jgi:hypothetical protein
MPEVVEAGLTTGELAVPVVLVAVVMAEVVLLLERLGLLIGAEEVALVVVTQVLAEGTVVQVL